MTGKHHNDGTLKGRNRILVGLTLFSMFFGAGNLIFPPFLGAMAGRSTVAAMTGFAMTAVGFPVLGVVAVAESGGLKELASRVHPKFAFLFTLLIYLSIGPCLAIPRTAGISFEMAVRPFAGNLVSGTGITEGMLRAGYSILFFGVAFVVALKPEKLTERLGKILTPCLLILIFLLFIGCLIRPAGGFGKAAGGYENHPLVKGFLEGYLTMDTIAALNFGIIIALNIKGLGVQKEQTVVRETVWAGILAGGVLLAVYSALAYIGAVAGGSFYGMENGTQTLGRISEFLFGKTGLILLGVIFLIACLNTCIGLLSCCSNYFCTLIPAPGYTGWVAAFALISMVISNVGLNAILQFSVPVLNAIYPMAIVLILLALSHRIWRHFRYVYQGTMLFTGVVSFSSALFGAGISIPGMSEAIRLLPFSDKGLEWTIPAVFGLAAGLLLSVSTFGKKARRQDKK